MKTVFVDRKSWLTVSFFYLVNKIVSRFRYKKLNIVGGENIPAKGSFLLIANHSSRWDGLVLMETMGRAANWMVSPNELKGLQGLILRSVGAFPADRKFELLSYVAQQLKKGEPVVIFPEGNVFKDGVTHPFKTGAARILLSAKEMGLDLPVVSVAINYVDEKSVNVVVSAPFWLKTQFASQEVGHQEKIRQLTNDLYRKLSGERTRLQNASPAPALAVSSVKLSENCEQALLVG